MASSSPPGSGDTAFRELVIDVLERLERDCSAALEDACRAHPHLADRLRRRVSTLGDLGLIDGEPARAAIERVGDFRLLEPIGAGGMGIVYRAVQESLQREVALKLIRPEILGLPKARERFARETSIVARLQHPGIVPVYTVGGADELPYYAMEWVRGCTLAEALMELAERGPERLEGADLERAVRARTHDAERLPEAGCYLFAGSWEATCLRIARQVAEALEHAHRRGVLHRDVKPGNVMLTPDGRVMLLDFGLSQASGEDVVTKTGERLGSLPYMPPELLDAGTAGLDERSDVYSLGVTLYQMLTLELPYAAKSEPAAVRDILEGRPRRPRERLSTLSWEAETVCLAALDRDPARRYASAADLARDLENALEHRPVEARRASMPLRARRWIQRRPGEAAALALAVLLAVSVPSLIAWFESREARRAGDALEAVRTEQARTEAQRLRAEENYAVALGTVDTLLRKVGEERLDGIPGMVALRGELAAAADRVYRQLQERQPDDPELVRLAAGSQRLRAVTSRLQGRAAEAEALLRSTIAELEPWLEDGSYELRRVHALCLRDLADLEFTPQRLLDALSALRALLVERPDDQDLRLVLVRSARNEAVFERLLGDRRSSVASIVRVEDEARDLAASEPGADGRVVLAKALDIHGKVLWNEGRFGEARGKYEESLELFRTVLEEDPSRDDARAGLADAAIQLGGVLGQLDLDEESLFVLDEASQELAALVEAYPGDSGYAYDLAELHKNRGISLGKLGLFEESQRSLELSLAAFQSLERRFPQRGSLDLDYGIVNTNLAMAWASQGDFERALAALDTARRHILVHRQLRPGDETGASWVGVERIVRSNVLLKIPRPAEAAEVLADAPRLVAHRLDRVEQTLRCLIRCVREARETGDDALIRRTVGAAHLGLQSAEARGDADHLPALADLRETLELP